MRYPKKPCMCRSGHAWRLHAHGKEWERSLWGANGGMSAGDSERSGFGGYEKQVQRVCMGLTASSGYDRWGYECLGWEIGE